MSPTILLSLTAVATLGALSLVLAALLVGANRRLQVYEDPRIDVVDDLLPGANCGACGFPGCRSFAEAVVKGEAQPAGCTVGTDAARAAIAEFLGVEVGAQVRRVARLACAGGRNVARMKARGVGLDSCAAAALVGGGGKACAWGCLGLGDCDVACDFDAISMNVHGLPVVDEDLCTGCGDCVVACPKDLFSLQRIDRRLWVACASREAGDEVLEDCEVACTACGRCAADAPDLITMQDNLPVIDMSREPSRVPIERCPTGAIVWLDPDRGLVKGSAAHRVIRRGPLPLSPT
ncbi:MAG: RnfABCDGE type electron transport complex subunit B [Deltaproteobacteria bacterium]|nr:MAG: RnfABCDGE type electron transport complex subunit B [Deltaproteobacteria bacterium]